MTTVKWKMENAGDHARGNGGKHNGQMRAQDLLLSCAGGHGILWQLLHGREQGPRRRLRVRVRTSRMPARRHTDADPILINDQAASSPLNNQITSSLATLLSTGLKLLSIMCLNWARSSVICCSGFSPKRVAMKAPSRPPGGAYSRETRTSVSCSAK